MTNSATPRNTQPTQPTPHPSANGHFSVWKLQFNLATVVQIAVVVAVLVAGWHDLKSDFAKSTTRFEFHSQNDWDQRDDADFMHEYSTINGLMCPPHRRVDGQSRADVGTD
jgi:hypothetical protein